MLKTFATVRDGRPQDAVALSCLHVESWQLAYRGIIPDRQLRATLATHDLSWWRRRLGASSPPLVLIADDRIAGYATYGRSRVARGPKGEIFELYLAPVFQGLGLGADLFETARERLDRAGLDGLVVWVLSDNTPALRFYRRHGGREAGRAVELFGTARLKKTALVWR